jgi:hypothetical protein
MVTNGSRIEIKIKRLLPARISAEKFGGKLSSQNNPVSKTVVTLEAQFGDT